jgi:flagellar basal-body rod protein FlgG
MLRQGAYLDATAHNVANAATPGFRAVRAVLESGDIAPATGSDQATGTTTPGLSAKPVLQRLFTQGSVRDTGRMTDLAITGEGFFAVRRPDGSQAYTRNGAFTPDARGRLTDTAGNLVQPPITVPNGALELRITANGTVLALMQDGSSQEAGQLRLARFTNPHGLEAGADGLFTATAASGQAQLFAPGQNGAGNVRTGALEDANSDITDQMTSVLAAQRAFQLNSSAFRMADEMLRLATQMAGNA